jgi:hypothetical protein
LIKNWNRRAEPDIVETERCSTSFATWSAVAMRLDPGTQSERFAWPQRPLIQTISNECAPHRWHSANSRYPRTLMDSPIGQSAFCTAVPTADEINAAIASFRAAPSPVHLHCGVQHYSWGDPHFIPTLIDARNPRGLPFAELWIGAHPDLLSTVQLGGLRLSLAELITAAPETMLGAETAARFDNQLPFLLKLLAARQPLSIQAHPTREQARAGYQQEDADRSAINRSTPQLPRSQP